MKTLFISALFIVACSGEPFEAAARAVDGGTVSLKSPEPCTSGPLCDPCSTPAHNGPGPGECAELIAALGGPRHAHCSVDKRCTFACTNPDVTPGVCDALGARCVIPPNDSWAQAPFCIPF